MEHATFCAGVAFLFAFFAKCFVEVFAFPAHKRPFALIEAKTAAVWRKACVLDECFGLFDGREAVILENVLFDDNAVDVVGTGVEPEFAERKSHAEERYFDMRDVVEIKAAEGEQLEVFVPAHVTDWELVGLRLECPHDKALETVGDVLRLADVFQMFDYFFVCFDATDDDVCASGKAFLVAGGKRVAPLLCGELFRAQNLTHAVGEDFGACARYGTESRILQDVDQFVERDSVGFGDADKFNWRKTADLNVQFLREHLQHVCVVRKRDFPIDAALQKNLVGAFGFGFERLLADFVKTQDVCFGALGGAAKTAKTASHFAHVRVVHNAECGIAHAVSGELGVAHHIGGSDNICPGRVFQNFEPFRWREALLVNGFFQKGIHCG